MPPTWGRCYSGAGLSQSRSRDGAAAQRPASHRAAAAQRLAECAVSAARASPPCFRRRDAVIQIEQNANGGKLPDRKLHVAVPPIMLGTAQLGMPYGLGAARRGLDEATAQNILDKAWRNGIRGIDTARAYGAAEARIGRWLKERAPAPMPLIVSKFPRLDGVEPARAVEDALALSLRALGVGRIDLYLAHYGADLLHPGVADSLRRCMAAGKIGVFGASVYDPEEAERLLEIPGLAALQMPLNIANTAAADSGLLAEASRRGIAIFARSIFLQGLLLCDAQARDARFSAATPALDRLEALARDTGISRAALALAAVRALPGIASIVIGVDSVAQLAETIAASNQRVDRATIDAALAIGRSLPTELADPRRWSR